MLQQFKKREEGFTIIEVMIVLAIAGLIMLIVFLAVPALERTSRNTQRKNDASAVASAIANFISDNGGGLPVVGGTAADSIHAGGDAKSVDVCSTAACTGAGNTYEAAKLGYYPPSGVSIVAASATPGVPTTQTIIVDLGYNCNANNTGPGTATTNTAAVLYSIENSGGASSEQCVEQ